MLTRRRSARLQEAMAAEEPKVEAEKDSTKTAARKRASKAASSAEPPKTRTRGAPKTVPTPPKPKTPKRNNKRKNNVKAKEEDDEMEQNEAEQEDMEIDETGEEPGNDTSKDSDLTDTVTTPKRTSAAKKKRGGQKNNVERKKKEPSEEPTKEDNDDEEDEIQKTSPTHIPSKAEADGHPMDTDPHEKPEENGKEEDSDASDDEAPQSRPITPSQRKNPVRSSAAKTSYKQQKDESSGDSDMTSSDSESTFRDSDEDLPKKKKSPASAKGRLRHKTPSPSTSDDEEEGDEEEESDFEGEDSNEKKPTKRGNKSGAGKKTPAKAKASTSRRGSGGCSAVAPKTLAGGRKGMVKPWESHTVVTSVGNVVLAPPPMRKVELFMYAFKIIAGKLAEGRNKEIGVDELDQFADTFVELRKEYKADKMAFVRRIIEGREKKTDEERGKEEMPLAVEGDGDDGSSSEDEWLEMEPVVEEGKKVQITVGGKPSADEAIQRGAEFIRQEVNKRIREKWENGHKVHLLCYIAHLQYTVKVVLHEMTVPYFITSQLPEGLAALQGEPISLSMAKKIAVWYVSNFKPATDVVTVSDEAIRDTRYPETARYAVLAEKKTYETDYERATLLFALFVGLDAIARICVNTRPIPRRWDNATIAKLSSPKGENSSKNEKSKGKKKEKFKEEMDYWVEYWNTKEKRWICIDPATSMVDNAVDLEKNSHSPIHYIFAIDNKKGVRDVSARYASDFLKPDFRRRRTDEGWLMRTLKKPLLKADAGRATLEDTHFRTEMISRPLPTSLAEYKNHPLYVLEKDILKYQAIYPPPSEQKELGEVKGHKVYPRDTVHCLQGALNWIKLARSVKEGEKAYKVVKARLNPRIPAEGQEKFLEVFGFWQTEPYRNEIVENGKIPRNKYGNVYMYQPTMCPIGATYLRLPGLPTIARRLHKECVPAVIGWEFSGSANHPIIEGACVLEEDVDAFIEEWKKSEARREEREAKRREERIYANWKKLITGIVRLHRVHAKFGSVPKKTKKAKKEEIKKEEEGEPAGSGIIDMTEQPKTKEMALHDVMGFNKPL